MTSPGGRSRGRRPADPVEHLMVSRELSSAMRQIRVRSGCEKQAVAAQVLAETVRELYPDAPDRHDEMGRARRGHPSRPFHGITERHISNWERGNFATLNQSALTQTAGKGSDELSRLIGGRIPPWAVRAYDVAFGADGYLTDLYVWSVALAIDHEDGLPRARRDLLSIVRPGNAAKVLSQGFEDAPEELRRLLAEYAEVLERRRAAAGTAPGDDWQPDVRDGSGSFGEGEDEHPEGMLVSPGEFLTQRFVLRNLGAIPWRDRVLYRGGFPHQGILSPPVLPLPDTGPGGQAEVRCPLRVPAVPGTYRVCLKAGWPDGTYCFPNSLVGVILTVIVPPPDLAPAGSDWTRHDT